MRYQGDRGLLLPAGPRAASGLIANYLYCASLAVFLCRACRWLLCGKLSRALLSGPWLITAEGITPRSQAFLCCVLIPMGFVAKPGIGEHTRTNSSTTCLTTVSFGSLLRLKRDGHSKCTQDLP